VGGMVSAIGTPRSGQRWPAMPKQQPNGTWSLKAD